MEELVHQLHLFGEVEGGQMKMEAYMHCREMQMVEECQIEAHSHQWPEDGEGAKVEGGQGETHTHQVQQGVLFPVMVEEVDHLGHEQEEWEFLEQVFLVLELGEVQEEVQWKQVHPLA